MILAQTYAILKDCEKELKESETIEIKRQVIEKYRDRINQLLIDNWYGKDRPEVRLSDWVFMRPYRDLNDTGESEWNNRN